MATTAPPPVRPSSADAAALPPGPVGGRFAQAARWGLRYPEFTAQARARFGSTYTVRVGTMEPFVLTTDGDAIKTLFTGDPLSRASANDVLRPLVGWRSILLLEPAEHLQRRKLLLPPFHGERIEGYRRVAQDAVDAELRTWPASGTTTVLPSAQRIALEVILGAVLGVRDPELRERLRTLIDDLTAYPINSIWRRLPGASRRQGAAALGSGHGRVDTAAAMLTPAVLTYFPRFKERSWRNPTTLPFFRIHDRLCALMDELVDAARRDPRLEERDDILAMLVQARDEDGAGLGDDDLRDELFALMAAGHETTAAAIAWGAELLAHHPDVRERAARAASDGDHAYLRAVVREVLRIRPPLPIAAGRILTHDVLIGDHVVPAGTPILIDSFGVHHDPQRWPEPERFDPERFVEGTPPAYSWLPFGGGAHRCIGSALAEMEIAVALGTMLREFDVTPAAPELSPIVRRAITLFPSGGGQVRVARRAAG